MREQCQLWDAAKDEYMFDVFADVGQPEREARIRDGLGGTFRGMTDPGTLLIEPVDPADRVKMHRAFDRSQLELRVADRAVPCFFVRNGELGLAGAWFRRES